MSTKRRRLRNRQRSTQNGKTMTACITPPDASRDGSNINLATIAPNNPNVMTTDFIDKTATNVPVESTTNPEEIKIVVKECGEDSHSTEGEAIVVDAVHDEPQPSVPFDPASFRIYTDNSNLLGKRIVRTLPCRKPNKQEFVRARPGDWSIDTMLVKNEITGEHYLVLPALYEAVAEDCFYARLTLATTQGGEVFLWLQKLPAPNGRSNRWNDSMLAAAQHAETAWIRVDSNLHAGCYEITEAPGITAEPKWPEQTFSEILSISFKDRCINSPNHPFLKRLRGKA